MSCFDVNTTSCFNSPAAVAALAAQTTMPNFELAAVMDQLAQLYPSGTSAATTLFNMPIVSQPVVSVIQSLSLPLLSLPTATTMALSGGVPEGIAISTSPVSLPTSHLRITPVVSTPVSQYSAMNILPPALSNQTPLNPVSPGNFVPPLPSSAFPCPEPSSSSVAHLSPPLASAPLRRKSAPEGMLRIPPESAKRRYSDFNVESLLNRAVVGDIPFIDHRRSSGRKQRTIYGAKQTKVLEEAFTSQKYMVGTERELLASRLGLSEAQVRVWFQNRRSKQRKILRIEEERQNRQVHPSNMT